MKLIRRMFALLLIAAVCGGMANIFLPQRIAWSQDHSQRVEVKAESVGLRIVSLEQVKQFIEAGTHVVFDARASALFEVGHIPTAMSLPYMRMDEAFDEVSMWLDVNQAIVVYCSGRSCDESLELGIFLKQQGFDNVSLLVDGMEGWRESGEAIEVGL